MSFFGYVVTYYDEYGDCTDKIARGSLAAENYKDAINVLENYYGSGMIDCVCIRELSDSPVQEEFASDNKEDYGEFCKDLMNEKTEF